MAITYQEAVSQLNAWTQTESLRKHARAVEIVMRAAAAKYGGGADAEAWAITGLLHDADYDQWPDEHPRRIVDWLREQGEEEIAYAVSFHQTTWNLPPKTHDGQVPLGLRRAGGLRHRLLLVRPEGIATLEPKSVKKKLKDKAFAAKVDREIIQQEVELLGVDLDEHIQFVIDALKPHAAELGIGAARRLSSMKFALIIPDGCADEPQESLGRQDAASGGQACRRWTAWRPPGWSAAPTTRPKPCRRAPTWPI